MTDELDPGDGMRDHIVEFVSCGPKNCGYRTKREKTEVKVRELNLNVRGSEMLHFESRKRSLQAEVLDPQKERRTITVPNLTFIHRNPATKVLTTICPNKTRGLVFDRRVVEDGGFITFPYSYAWFPPEEEWRSLRRVGCR